MNEWLRTSFTVDHELHIPVTGGGDLTLSRGTVICELAFTERIRGPISAVMENPPIEGRDLRHTGSDDDSFVAEFELADSLGRMFSLQQVLPANLLLEMVRLAPRTSQRRNLTLLLRGLRCNHDPRGYLATFGVAGSRLISVRFHLHNLDTWIDLYRERRSNVPDDLVLNVRAQWDSPKIDICPAPDDLQVLELWVACDTAANALLFAAMLMPNVVVYIPRPVFRPVPGRRIAPQPLVRRAIGVREF